MKLRTACASLALCSASTLATPTSWDFVFYGFHYVQGDVYDPNAGFRGSFSGNDSDADGVLSAAELTGFYFPSGMVEGVNWIECAPIQAIDYTCQIDRFLFSPQDGLSLKASISAGDRYAGYYESFSFDTGAGWQRTVGSPRGGAHAVYNYLWTEQTASQVIPAIPEPAQAWLLGAGLALLVARSTCARRPA